MQRIAQKLSYLRSPVVEGMEQASLSKQSPVQAQNLSASEGSRHLESARFLGNSPQFLLLIRHMLSDIDSGVDPPRTFQLFVKDVEPRER